MKWISVDESLPGHGKHVLIKKEEKIAKASFYFLPLRGGYFFILREEPQNPTWEPTHWAVDESLPK